MEKWGWGKIKKMHDESVKMYNIKQQMAAMRSDNALGAHCIQNVRTLRANLQITQNT